VERLLGAPKSRSEIAEPGIDAPKAAFEIAFSKKAGISVAFRIGGMWFLSIHRPFRRGGA
jgi:hypothetical protein